MVLLIKKNYSDILNMKNVIKYHKPNRIVRESIDLPFVGEDDRFYQEKCKQFSTRGYLVVHHNNKSNILKKDKSLVSHDQWFDDVLFCDGKYAIIGIDKRYTFIDMNGNMLFPNLWFTYCRQFVNGFAVVEGENGKINYLDKKGNILSPNRWFDACYDFHNGLGKVCDKENPNGFKYRFNYIDKKGNLISPYQWFDGDCSSFGDGHALVHVNGKLFLLNKDGWLCDKSRKPLLNLKEHGFSDTLLSAAKNESKSNRIDRIISETLQHFIINEASNQATPKQIGYIKLKMFFTNIYSVSSFGVNSHLYAATRETRPQYGKYLGPLFQKDDTLKTLLIQTNFNLSFDLAKRTIEYINMYEDGMLDIYINWDKLDKLEKSLLNDISIYNGIQPPQQQQAQQQQPQPQLSLNDRFKNWSSNLSKEINKAMSEYDMVFIPEGFLEYTKDFNERQCQRAYAHGELEDRLFNIYEKTEDDNVMREPQDLMLCCTPNNTEINGIFPCKVIGIKQPCVYKAVKNPMGNMTCLVTLESDKDSLDNV